MSAAKQINDQRPARLYDGDTFTRNGHTIRVTFPRDEEHGEPWKAYDGHGVVSEWTRREKAPGERILHSDGHEKLYYDVKASIAIALRDSWGPAEPGDTKRQTAARAVDRDYEFLRGWCADEWCYVGVVVERLENGRACGDSASVWGMQSQSDSEIRAGLHEAQDYLTETAWELVDEIEITRSCPTCHGSGRVPE